MDAIHDHTWSIDHTTSTSSDIPGDHNDSLDSAISQQYPNHITVRQTNQHTATVACATLLPMLDDACLYRDLGFSILPLCGKTPALPHWKHLTQRYPTGAELEDWFQHSRHNIGIICGRISGVIALDGDCADIVTWIEKNLPATPMMTRSSEQKRHFYYRIEPGQIIPPRVKVSGMQLDVRGEVSYCVAAHSIHPETGEPYQRVGSWKLSDVPLFDPSWMEADPMQSVISRKHVKNIDGYLAKVESIQGKNGSAGLVRACAICRDSGISEAEAMVKLIRWNQSGAAKPPWALDSLARAVTRTYAKRQKP
jgi:hypothetical protein